VLDRTRPCTLELIRPLLGRLLIKREKMNATALRELNGWQRLSLLVASLWLMGAVIITGLYFPTERAWRSSALLEMWELEREHDAQVKPFMERCLSYDTLEASKCFTDYYQEVKNLRNVRFQVGTDLERRIADDLLMQQVKAVGLGVALWIFPLIALYLLSMAIAWVRKGFHAGD